MLNEPIGIYPFEVKSYEADVNGKMTLHAFFHYLQECAWINAEENGFGYKFVERENAYWVLSRVLVHLTEYPHWDDSIEIKTWPKGANGLFALRDFQLVKNNNIIGNIASFWLMLDKSTKRPKRVTDYGFTTEKFISDNAINCKLDKIDFNGTTDLVDKRKVYPSDMDVNGHVNNATYVRLILDSYYSNPNSKQVKEFEINFISELALNDSFTVHSYQDIDQLYYVIKNEKERDVCKARIK